VSAFFITSCGTEIGKTLVTSALCRQLRKKGRAVKALKPVISGYDAETASESDTYLLLDALGSPIDEETIAGISPWRFKQALSPDMAAERDGRSIPYDELISFCRKAIVQNTGTLLIEGVGGVMVPLGGPRTVLDWASDLKIPALLVTGSYLGSLSHALTAVKALESGGVPLAGVVVSESEECPVPVEETVATLVRLLPGISIVSVPRQQGEIDWSAVPDLTELVNGIHKAS